MARKPTQSEPPREPELRVSHEEAAQKLDDRIAKGKDLLRREIHNAQEIEKLDEDYDKWNAYNRDLLSQLCTTDKLRAEYSNTGSGGILVMSMERQSHAARLAEVKGYISGKIGALESTKERLELLPTAAGATLPRAAPAARSHTNRAFIVHGHDEAARETLARFLERLGIEAIILHEQPTEGRTIIEKLEHYSDVDFAIILLTPDDIGASKLAADNLQPRARQNVVLELGYFAAKLGRKRVCAMYQGPLETPSDYVGVVYIELDAAGGWQLKLARELRAAEFTIDMNALAG